MNTVAVSGFLGHALVTQGYLRVGSTVLENALARLESKNVGWTMFKGVFKPGLMEHDTVLQRALERLEKK